MSLRIDLLGPPSIESHGGNASGPRGRKAWGLLAYLLLTGRASSREALAGLLFDEAEDPLGALRWNLAELRRSLGPEVRLGGDPVELTLPPDAVVDVRILASGTWVQALRMPGLGRELLEGLDASAGATFEMWLLAERGRLAGISAAILREAATARLASGDTASAVEHATRLVALDELDEEAHALLIRAYVRAGDGQRARQQLASSIALFREQLGVEPSATLVRAADPASGSARAHAVIGRSSTMALLEAGRAAVNAGAVDSGLETLRRAAAEAHDLGDKELETRTMLALGIAYVHGGRGRDGEGATVLHASLAIAERLGVAEIIAESCRELGYIEFLRARYDRAEGWLRRAISEAPGVAERSAVQGVLGAVICDRGRTVEAVQILGEAAAVARAAGKPRVEGWATAFLGRAHLLRGDYAQARAVLGRAMQLCRTSGWVSFIPWPQSLLGNVELAEGRLDAASDAFEGAFAVGCQLGDPCWEGMGARGIGLTHIALGRIDEGIAWLDDARTRCVRIPDAYLWIQAYCLDALAAAAIDAGRPEARRWIADLEALASRTGMREMLVRSQVMRARLGDRGSREAAVLFAAEIDNPLVLALSGASVSA